MKSMKTQVLYVAVASFLALSCSKKEKASEDLLKKDDKKEAPKPEVKVEPVPETNISVVAKKHAEEFKKLGLPTAYKKCTLDFKKNLMINAKMRERIHYRRAENHSYMGNYLGIAVENENIAKVYEDEFDKNADWMVTAATNYHRGGDHEKALQLYRDVKEKRPNNLRVLQRFSIFLSTAKAGVRDFVQAESLANQAWELARTEKERNLAADAYSELAFAKYGLDSACSVLEEKATFSHANERCSELRNKYSRYTVIMLKRAVKSSLREAWKTSGVPEGEPSCEEQLYYLNMDAVQLTSDRQFQPAVDRSLELLGYDMHYGYYVEYLTDLAEQLYNLGEKDKAWAVFDLAAKIAPEDCYPLANKAAILIKDDEVKNKAQAVELSQQAMKVCNMANRSCMYQVALNYKRVSEKQEALKIAKEGKTLFPTYDFGTFIANINRKNVN